jgi:6-phosphogluconolactonase (cycloisomerase 2 family)
LGVNRYFSSDRKSKGGKEVPYALYICLQDDDKIAAFAIDAETGRLTPQTEVPTTGGPSVMASSPDRRTLYVGHRTRPAISTSAPAG